MALKVGRNLKGFWRRFYSIATLEQAGKAAQFPTGQVSSSSLCLEKNKQVTLGLQPSVLRWAMHASTKLPFAPQVPHLPGGR
jgi:hypothetical protein